MTHIQIRINVTAGDIQRGHRCSPTECPIARAIRRLVRLPDAAVAVCGVNSLAGTVIVSAFSGDSRLRGTLPEIARQFAVSFDVGRPVRPFSFALELQS